MRPNRPYKTALSLLCALGMGQLCIDTLCTKDGNFKFLIIVADASAANKLASKIVAYGVEADGS